MGTSVQAFGTLSTCLIHALNVVTGNLDRAGGSMFTTPAVDLPALLGRLAPADLGAFRSRVRGLPSLAGELPAAALAEEIDTPGPGQIRALLTSAGNPVLSAPNGARLDRALSRLDFMASIDLHVNETTRHAHVILPPTPTLAHGHYDLLLHLTAVRNTARYSPPILAPDPDARHDWEIYAGLEARLAPAGVRGLAGALLRQASPERIVDLLLRAGPHGDRFGLRPGGLSLSALRAAPHGVDLGPLEPRLPGLLAHRDRRLHLAPPEVIAEIDRLDHHLAAPRPALVLVGRRDRRSCNTWLHNSARLQRGLHPCRLLVHPDDAAARGLADGARVRVTSRVGAVEVEITVSDAVLPGVVCLPFGYGHGRPGVRLRIASANPGVSLNDLTDDAEVDVPSGTAVLSGTPVEIERGQRP
jgi:anaerobic selenocysteine-containing dehydrogenase